MKVDKCKAKLQHQFAYHCPTSRHTLQNHTDCETVPAMEPCSFKYSPIISFYYETVWKLQNLKRNKYYPSILFYILPNGWVH